MLKDALTAQSVFRNEPENQGGGKGLLIQNGRTGALSTLNNQSVCCDVYNQSVDDAVAPSLTAAVGGTNTSGAKVLQQCIGFNRERSGAECMEDACPTMQAAAGQSGNNKPMICLNDQGGSMMSVTEDVSGCLRAAEHGHQPAVVNSPTYCIQGNCIDRADTAGCNGKGWNDEDISYTLNTIDRPAVCGGFKAGQSKAGGIGWAEEQSATLSANCSGTEPTVLDGRVPIENHPADSRVKLSEDGIFQTLSSRMGTGGGNTPMVLEGRAYCTSKASYHTVVNEEKAGALVATDYKDPPCVYGLDRAAFNQGANAQYQFSVGEEKIGAQVARGPGAVCTAVDCRNATESEINACLQSSADHNNNSNNVCRSGSIVRRLTPLECERLQGFPDGWTNIGEWTDSKGKRHKDVDSPRYKALGNSIALPFWAWLARRICAQYERPMTMASLFDGIGGFPLVFSRAGCRPVWASEIEEFPIAVTKRRFGDE